MRRPRFTDDHLRAIHHALHNMAWRSEHHYDARREVVAILDKYFGSEKQHLQHDEVNPKKEKQP